MYVFIIHQFYIRSHYTQVLYKFSLYYPPFLKWKDLSIGRRQRIHYFTKETWNFYLLLTGIHFVSPTFNNNVNRIQAMLKMVAWNSTYTLHQELPWNSTYTLHQELPWNSMYTLHQELPWNSTYTLHQELPWNSTYTLHQELDHLMMIWLINCNLAVATATHKNQFRYLIEICIMSYQVAIPSLKLSGFCLIKPLCSFSTNRFRSLSADWSFEI